MEQAVFAAMAAEFHRYVEETIAEADAVEEFARTYPHPKMPAVSISPKGRDLGEQYVVTVQGRAAKDFSRKGPYMAKINELVYRAQHRRQYPHPPR